MITICLVNESALTGDEMLTIKLGVEDYVCSLLDWQFGDIKISLDAPLATDWIVYITTRHRGGSAGRHTVEHGIPVAYCLPNTARNRFGTYRAPFVIKGKQLRAEIMRQGTLSVICHEVAEMLGDPLTYTLSAPDSQGRKWLREIVDPVQGVLYMKIINGKNCIFPDVVLPSFYDLKGKAPYTVKNSLTAPFTKSPLGGKAYYVDKGIIKEIV